VRLGFLFLFLVESVIYYVLLIRLSGSVRSRKPEIFASTRGLHSWDFLTMGFGPGDSLIATLESRKPELADDRQILRLLHGARIAWTAIALTALGLFFWILLS
jgi:hypothetical protein